jgi:sucrose phosphorylase
VIDYRQVKPDFGDWEDVQSIGDEFQLMFDAVINHISAKSDWFQRFLKNEIPYNDYFKVVDPAADLSAVVRPRDLPLLTPFTTPTGEVHVWTTFSADQIDLNFSNPDVLFRILDLLLYYIKHGARVIRLDAIAFMWKEIGTSCIHLPQTHAIIKLMRAIVDHVAPHVLLLTETNVPHEENISYFGKGDDEAHMVYQFALPPLIFHTLTSGDATRLSDWAEALHRPSEKVTYFNFTASHDGIGVRPARGILSEDEIEKLIQLVQEHGGGVSYRRVGKHDRQAYELNINYFDALNNPAEVMKQPQRAIDRFLCSQAIMLAFPGLPAIYFHSLFGSQNDPQGVERTGHLRSINREKFPLQPFEEELAHPGSLRFKIFQGFQRLLRARQSHSAFDPWGKHKILKINPRIFTIMHFSLDGTKRVLCMHEVSGQPLECNAIIKGDAKATGKDLLTGEDMDLSKVRLNPFQVRWIKLE